MLIFTAEGRPLRRAIGFTGGLVEEESASASRASTYAIGSIWLPESWDQEVPAEAAE